MSEVRVGEHVMAACPRCELEKRALTDFARWDKLCLTCRDETEREARRERKRTKGAKLSARDQRLLTLRNEERMSTPRLARVFQASEQAIGSALSLMRARGIKVLTEKELGPIKLEARPPKPTSGRAATPRAGARARDGRRARLLA